MRATIKEAILKFNAMNAQDPSVVDLEGEARPRELLAAERLEAWVRRVEPHPSEALLLASRCQHLMRFRFPRSDYPDGRIGYLKWRKELSRKHADLASEVLTELGVSQETIEEVRVINLKDGLKTNPDTQAMEDSLCLSFLEHEFSLFSAKHDDEKVIDIVQKTWRKMSPRGHELALTIALGPRESELVKRALE